MSDETSFSTWIALVDGALLRKYSIDVADTGLTDAELRKHWQCEPSANKFVEWFAEKYDLISRSRWAC